MAKEAIEALIGSPPNAEQQVVQLFVKNGGQWGEIYREDGEYWIDIYRGQGEKPASFAIDEMLAALSKSLLELKDRLAGKQ